MLALVGVSFGCGRSDGDATSIEARSTAPASGAEAQSEDEAEIAELQAFRTDIEASISGQFLADGTLELRPSVRSLDRLALLSPVIDIELDDAAAITIAEVDPDGVYANSLNGDRVRALLEGWAGCTQESLTIRCELPDHAGEIVEDQGLIPTRWIGPRLVLTTDALSASVTVTATSELNALTNEPDPTNNVATVVINRPG
ncbi:MAG: hypothetical protein AAF567_03585 [Actinomycetota bacterium]